MANEPVGFKRAVNAAWEKLPEILIAAVVALSVFGFGLWLDTRDLKRNLASVMDEQEPVRLCERISSCSDGTSGAKREIAELRALTQGNRETLIERGIRISNLEQQMYEIKTKPSFRPDPFTGTEGRELENRIRALEKK